MENIKDFYGRLIDLIGFIVGHTSDQGADIAIRALPILSPMPNAIGIYYVSMTVLGFGNWQALAFALAIELALFGLFEVTLMMFDGIQVDEQRYRWPFFLSVGVSAVIMLLIITVVFWLETAHPILAVLPLFSAAGAVALALRRWHARNTQTRLDAFKVAFQLNEQLKQDIERLNEQLKHETQQLRIDHQLALEKLTNELDAERFNEQERSAELERTVNELRIENARLSERLSVQNTIVPGVEVQKKATETDTDKRRMIVLDFYRDNPGVPYSQAAERLKLSKSTIYNDVQFWSKRGTIHVNGNGVEVLS